MSSSRAVLRSLPFASSLASHNKMRTAKQLLLECLCTQAQVQVCKSFFFFFLFTNAVPTITMSNVIWTARNQNCKQQLHKDLKCTLLQLTKPVWVPGHSPCWMISSKHIYTCSRHIYKKKGLITDGTQQMSELQLNKQLEVWACYNYYTWWILDRKEQK